MDRRSIHIIIPAYNERPIIGATVAQVVSFGYTLIVVDDGSLDGTWAMLQELPVIRIRHLINLGQGAALQTGMTYALRNGARVIVHFDADGQHDPEDIPRMVALIENDTTDVVLGSRFLRDSDRFEVPWIKRVILRCGRFVSGIATGVWLSDTHNGFRAFSHKAAAILSLRENGFAHATEILEQIHRAGLRYVELPTRITYTEYARAKGQRPANSLNILIDLILRKLFQ